MSDAMEYPQPLPPVRCSRCGRPGYDLGGGFGTKVGDPMKMVADPREVIGTYPRPKHGWTCFHCGDLFRTPGAARDHFGADPRAEPACRIKAGEEMGLVIALRKAEAERDSMVARMHKLDEELDVAQMERAEVLRAAKAKNSHEVRCNLESLEGRVIAAEATLKVIEATHPELVERARTKVCEPVSVHPKDNTNLNPAGRDLAGASKEAQEPVGLGPGGQ